MSTCDRIPLLEYLQGHLDLEAGEEVASHLGNCARCSQRFEVMLRLSALLNPEQRDSRSPLSASPDRGRPTRLVQSVRAEEFPKATRPSRSLWLAAAALLAALLVPGLLRMSSAPHELRARWATTQKHPEFPLVTRSSGSQTDVRSRAFKAYRRNSYREAERWFSELPETQETLFYRGVCLYFLEWNQEALSLLERASRKESRWQLPAFWFRANTLLKLNRLDEAYQLLQIVAANQSVYQEESRRLLEKVAP